MAVMRTNMHSYAPRICQLDSYTPKAYSRFMFTVVETPLFQKQWPLYWSEEERGEFAAYIAEFPSAGAVVPRSGGIRKVRWKRAGTGKSGGVRVIYFTRLSAGEIWLLLIYAKAVTATIPSHLLKAIRKEIEHA